MLGSICLSTKGDATVNQSKYPIGGNFEKRLKISEVPFMKLLTGSCRSTGLAASAFRIGAWACVLGHIRLFVTSWMVACQAPLWDFAGKITRVGCYFLFQRIFLTQGLNPPLLHWQADSLPLSHLGSPSVICNWPQLY